MTVAVSRVQAANVTGRRPAWLHGCVSPVDGGLARSKRPPSIESPREPQPVGRLDPRGSCRRSGRLLFIDTSKQRPLIPVGAFGPGTYDERQVFVLNEQDTCNPTDCTSRIQYLTNEPLSGNTFMLGFGEDAEGNIWALANETGIPLEETGLVTKLVRRCADKDFVNGNPDRRTPPCRD
jgi:hypothetical protein